MSNLVGAGSKNFGQDGRKENGDWEVGAPGLRSDGWQDIRGVLGGSKKRSSDALGDDVVEKKRRISPEPVPTKSVASEIVPDDCQTPALNTSKDEKGEEEDPDPPQIFRGLTMYLNGSTMPLVSDHRLKQLWVQHGGDASISLGRRTVTHVIPGEKGAGGGLAATKIQKENTTIRGKGIKYVSAQWVLDSIEKGVRQPESRYAAVDVKNKLGGSGQASVATLFRAKTG